MASTLRQVASSASHLTEHQNLWYSHFTDIGTASAGSKSLAPSANLAPERRHPGLFHPLYDSAPDIAAHGIVNLMVGLGPVQRMLSFSDGHETGELPMRAVEDMLTGREAPTSNLGGCATTA